MDHERIVPLDKSLTFGLNVLRVHLDPSVVLSDVHPNMWTPLMTCLREGLPDIACKRTISGQNRWLSRPAANAAEGQTNATL